jgi:hypothetical protein
MTRIAENQEETSKLVREVLGELYMHLHLSKVNVVEDLDLQTSTITCEVTDTHSGEKLSIQGKGTGPIDAFFKAMVERFSGEFPSLKTIKFRSFAVSAKLETGQSTSLTDSKGEVTLQIVNSEDKVFSFRHASRSIVESGLVATLLGLEYFVNSERAFVSIYHALKDARARNRSDLVQRFTDVISTLVQNTSYSEVISRIRSELGHKS